MYSKKGKGESFLNKDTIILSKSSSKERKPKFQNLPYQTVKNPGNTKGKKKKSAYISLPSRRIEASREENPREHIPTYNVYLDQNRFAQEGKKTHSNSENYFPAAEKEYFSRTSSSSRLQPVLSQIQEEDEIGLAEENEKFAKIANLFYLVNLLSKCFNVWKQTTEDPERRVKRKKKQNVEELEQNFTFEEILSPSRAELQIEENRPRQNDTSDTIDHLEKDLPHYEKISQSMTPVAETDHTLRKSQNLTTDFTTENILTPSDLNTEPRGVKSPLTLAKIHKAINAQMGNDKYGFANLKNSLKEVNNITHLFYNYVD